MKKKDNNSDVAVLYIIFNRLNSVKKTFPSIKKVKPKKLFIAADGPRNDLEKTKTDAVRKFVTNSIDWDCEVKTLFRNKNLGARHGVVGAISWFFSEVSEGIILEDDCLPNEYFFKFSQELLKKYRDSPRVMCIGGTNLVNKHIDTNSYIFSRYPIAWGWATWKNRWSQMDLDMNKYKSIKKAGLLKKYYPSFLERIIRKKRAGDTLNKNITAWDVPWSITHQLNNKLTIIPSVNLVENIGISTADATHTTISKWDEKFLHKKSRNLRFPLRHPEKIKLNKKYERIRLREDVERIVLKKLSI